MIKPELLKKGDTIGVIAPSDSIKQKDNEYIEKSIKLMEDSGFKVKLSKHIYSYSLGYSATIEEKVQDIEEMFKDEAVKAIFAVKGGENSNTLFEYLDYDLIKSNPKILCGFSDTTSLTNMITQKTGLVTFSGPTFKSLTSWETDYSYKETIKRFVDGSLQLGNNKDKYITIRESKNEVEGILVGGNLNLITGMVAGKYKLDFKDKILFIEELGFETTPTGCNRYLHYMKQNGVFNQIKGLWIGNYNHESNIKLEDIVIDVIGNEYNFPIIKSNNFGHTDKKTVIPIGTKAKIDTSKEIKIELIEKCCK